MALRCLADCLAHEVLKYSEPNKNKDTRYQNLKKTAKDKQEKVITLSDLLLKRRD